MKKQVTMQLHDSTIEKVNKSIKKKTKKLKLKKPIAFQVHVDELINIGLNFEE